MSNCIYEDLSKCGSVQQQPQLESVLVVDSPNFIHEYIPDVVDHPAAQKSAARPALKRHRNLFDEHSVSTKRNKQNDYAKKYRVKKAEKIKNEKLRVKLSSKSNTTSTELVELYKSVIQNYVDQIFYMTQIDDLVDFIKAFKDANLHYSHNYLIGNFNKPEEGNS
jgi:hypothetical protein